MKSEIPRPIRIFLLLALVLDSLGLACEGIAHYVWHMAAPYGMPTLPEAWGVDLTNYGPIFRGLHTPDFFRIVREQRYEYPAPVAPLYGFFFKFGPSVPILECTIVLLLAVAAFVFGRHLVKSGLTVAQSTLIAAGALALSYPTLFEMRQGNMEIFVCVLVGLGVFAFLRGHDALAAIFFGVAGAMKLFPFAYLGLFVARRRYLPILTSAGVAVVVTLVSLRYLDPSISLAWHGVQAGLAAYQHEVAPLTKFQTSYDHSLLALIKDVLPAVRPKTGIILTQGSLRAYLAGAAIATIVLFFFRIRRSPVTNQVLALCVVSILIPPVSFDYTLLHLYVPWALLVCFAIARGNRNTPGLVPAFVCLAVLTSIQTEFIYHHRSLEGAVKALALCSLMFIAVRYRFEHDAVPNSPPLSAG